MAACTLFACGCDSTSHAPPQVESAATVSSEADGESAAQHPVEQRVDGTPVTVIARLSHDAPRPGDEFELSIELRIAPLWEVRTLDAQPSVAATRIDIELPEGINAASEWHAPDPSRSISADGHPVYMGSATFRRTLQVDSLAHASECRMKCVVRYQACDERQCLAPQTVELVIPLRIAAR